MLRALDRSDDSGEAVRKLQHFPTSSQEHVVAVWLPLREAGAVVSHESALELHGLSDVVPVAVWTCA